MNIYDVDDVVVCSEYFFKLNAVVKFDKLFSLITKYTLNKDRFSFASC